MAALLIDRNDDVLTTISAKVPRWVEDTFISVARDADINESRAYCVALSAIAEYLRAQWRRGPTLSVFLEYLRFDVEKYNADFLREQGK
jgi:post-segregation antitoxin (ccd killing protein)